ncbi:MAG: hypothetical protein FWG14_04185 [Peptococcaceae bacterium]|nr:hypothetical protein [Peptococcaceae bacterium]
MLLIAAFVLTNQFNGFVNIGIGSIIVAALALAFAVQCITHLAFAPLPIPLAVLYIIFQGPLNWPNVQWWALVLAAVFASIGLAILLPRKHTHVNRHTYSHSSGNEFHKHHHHSRTHIEDGGNDNNPSVSVHFGSVSRYLHAACLETVHLDCNFGELQVFFDQAQLKPDGATAILNCSFGSIVLFIPKTWNLVSNLSCTLSGVETDNPLATPTENAPQLTLNGSVSFGSIEVRYI